MPRTTEEHWYNFWPDWLTGTLRVEFTSLSTFLTKFVDVVRFARFKFSFFEQSLKPFPPPLKPNILFWNILFYLFGEEKKIRYYNFKRIVPALKVAHVKGSV